MRRDAEISVAGVGALSGKAAARSRGLAAFVEPSGDPPRRGVGGANADSHGCADSDGNAYAPAHAVTVSLALARRSQLYVRARQ